MTLTVTFREHESGLYVPDEVSRTREVWTKQEVRLVNRTTTLLKSRGIQVMFACTSKQCADTAITRVPGLTGDFVLRCECKDRIFQRKF